MPLSLEQFTHALSDSGILSPDEVRVVLGTLPPDKRKDVEVIAKELVKAKKLTRFQAAAVYNGQTKGLIFGDYVVIDRIGSGGMGQVYKAQHRHMKRIVALKVLRQTASKSELAVKRFQREVETAAKLDNPHIVRAYDAGASHGTYFLVMQFIDGHDLEFLVKEGKEQLPADKVIDYVLQAANGLEYAHKRGIVHRDIKPSNLLLDKSGLLTILDMGLARLEDTGEEDEDEGRLTLPGQMMGTVNYMSPEQAADPRLADAKSDIYALGCTMYFMLTGGPPYVGANMALALLAHRDNPIPSLCEKRSDVSPEVDAVFQKMLAKKPADRYQTATEMIAALRAAAGLPPASSGSIGSGNFVPVPQPAAAAVTETVAASAATTAVAPTPPAGGNAGGLLSRRKWWVVAGGVLLLAIVAGVVMLATGGSSKPKPTKKKKKKKVVVEVDDEEAEEGASEGE